MTELHEIQYPNESAEYRGHRNALLQAEIDLRERLEAVAEMRRALPPGGTVPQDYVFEEPTDSGSRTVRMSELFEAEKPALLAYSFMYGPDMELPCPMCSAMLDGLDGQAVHIGQRANLVVIAKSPADRLRAWARRRGWRNLRLLSSAGNDYNRDYFGETPEGGQLPALNVFARDGSVLRHFWGSEMLYVKSDRQPRHVDLLWPLWQALDLTPQGRGTSWMPPLFVAR